jgi:Ca2+-binding EF-hand superfamily protein
VPHSMYVNNDTSKSNIPGIDVKDLRQVFRLIDADNDGQISFKDLRIYFESIGEVVTDAEITEMIRMADLGTDGYVHLSEFSDLFRQLDNDGNESHLFTQVSLDMSKLKPELQSLTRTGTRDTPEDIVARFITKLPGAIDNSAWIRRSVVKDIIHRKKDIKTDTVNEKAFFQLLNIKRTDSGERAFDVFSNHSEVIDIRSLLLILGVFVAASCEERIDFACRILDEANTGLLVEEQVQAIIDSNFVGIKTELRSRMDTIMKESDSNSLLPRKKLVNLAKTQPGLLFPQSRINPPRIDLQHLK